MQGLVRNSRSIVRVQCRLLLIHRCFHTYQVQSTAATNAMQDWRHLKRVKPSQVKGELLLLVCVVPDLVVHDAGRVC